MSNFDQQELDIILQSINNPEKLVRQLKCREYRTSKINEGIVLSKLLSIFNIKYLEITTEERPDFIIKTQLGNIFELEVVSIGCNNTFNEVIKRIIKELKKLGAKKGININISQDWTRYVAEDVDKESEIKLIINLCCNEIAQRIPNKEKLEENPNLEVKLFLEFILKKVKNNLNHFKEKNKAQELIENLKDVSRKNDISTLISNIRENFPYKRKYPDWLFQGQEYKNNKEQILNSIKNKFKKYKKQKLSGENATGVLGIKCGNHFQSILTNETHEYAFKLVKEINEDKDNIFKNHCYFSCILIVGNSCEKNYYLIRYQKENKIWSLIYQ